MFPDKGFFTWMRGLGCTSFVQGKAPFMPRAHRVKVLEVGCIFWSGSPPPLPPTALNVLNRWKVAKICQFFFSISQILGETWYTGHYSLKIWLYEILIKQSAGVVSLTCDNKCPDVVEILVTRAKNGGCRKDVDFNHVHLPLAVIRTINLNVEMTIYCSSWALLEPQSVLFHMYWTFTLDDDNKENSIQFIYLSFIE